MTGEFDMERLQELHDKAQHNDLSPEEIRELNAMMEDFNEKVKPLLQTMAEIYGDAARTLLDSLQPLAEVAEEHND